jgi:hypothetical protein
MMQHFLLLLLRICLPASKIIHRLQLQSYFPQTFQAATKARGKRRLHHLEVSLLHKTPFIFSVVLLSLDAVSMESVCILACLVLREEARSIQKKAAVSLCCDL